LKGSIFVTLLLYFNVLGFSILFSISDWRYRWFSKVSWLFWNIPKES